jgi:hypothetical protein
MRYILITGCVCVWFGCSTMEAVDSQDLNGCRPGTPKCQPTVCVGLSCSHNRGADGVCRANCGGEGFCPDLSPADALHCDTLCSSVTGTPMQFITCKQGCINSVRYDCTSGQEPIAPPITEAPATCGGPCTGVGGCLSWCECIAGRCQYIEPPTASCQS